MSQLFLNPYVNFEGKCREAMEFYHAAVGGKLELSAFGDNGAPRPAEGDEPIMHARLESDGLLLMASDGMQGHQAKVGDNVGLAVGGTDSERLHKIFDALSEGGNVTMKLEKAPLGDEYGQFSDKFGINWMVNISKEA